ncbi:MAG: class B sortase [Butyrivibrio sp.]|nr:class B sortase [Butyrivibrio sp.]
MKNKKILAFLAFVSVAAISAGVIGYIVADDIQSKESLSQMQEMAYENTSTEYVSEDSTIEGSTTQDSMITDSSMDLALESSTLSSDEDNSEMAMSEDMDLYATTEASGSEESLANVAAIDFDKLQASNPDIFAWINIPGTVIDYPVAQHPTDDTYYLKHGADGLSSNYGCPYIELSDSKNFTDFNTVLYGHNMNNGSMFAGLHKYEDNEFYQSHRNIYIYTPDHKLTYKVFAAVMYSDAHIPYYYNDLIESDRNAFLNSLKTDIVANRSYVSEDIEVTKDDRIITLSTCDKKLRSNRFLVVAVLTGIDGQEVK